MNRRTKQCISLGNFIFLLAGINQNLAETQEREKKKNYWKEVPSVGEKEDSIARERRRFWILLAVVKGV